MSFSDETFVHQLIIAMFWLQSIRELRNSHLLVNRSDMARQRKNPEERKDYHLRVPLTPGQRTLIEGAARLEGEEKAGWARAILLTAAKRTIAKHKTGS
jgi:hypothetical protein